MVTRQCAKFSQYSHYFHASLFKGASDDYCDPWDAKKAAPSSDRDDYCDPWDAQKSQAGKDNYSEPWDTTKRKDLKGPKRQEYCDVWDAKKPVANVAPSAAHKLKTSGDSDDDSYCEPYDTGRVAALDEQAKNMSLKGMRLSSHEPHSEGKSHRDDNIINAKL